MFNRIHLKSRAELETMREANRVVEDVLDALEAAITPGVSTQALDDIARGILDERGAGSAFLGYHGYPAVLCASVNEEVVHGFPDQTGFCRRGTSSASISVQWWMATSGTRRGLSL